MALELTNDNFDANVLAPGTTALVDFWAVWCGPCRMVGPIVEELSSEYEGKAVIGKLDVDKAKDIAMRYGIMNIPALLFFKDGEIVDKQVGAVPKHVLKQKLDAVLA